MAGYSFVFAGKISMPQEYYAHFEHLRAII